MRWSFFARPDNAEQRGQPRAPGHAQLACSLGELVDISLTGLRVACRGKAPDHPGQLEEITLSDGQHELTFTARVVRVTVTGRRQYELGLSFVGLTPRERRLLQALARLDGPANDAEERPCQSGGGVDHYQVLGVSAQSTPEQIRHAFHRLARQYHPDASHRGETAKMFQRVHEAYAVLKDPASRSAYDVARAGRIVSSPGR